MENKASVTISGITYIAVDEPIIKGHPYSCVGCDILNAKPPQTMVDRPLCYDNGSKLRNFFFGTVDKKRVTALCKLSDIEPYKEEEV